VRAVVRVGCKTSPMHLRWLVLNNLGQNLLRRMVGLDAVIFGSQRLTAV